MTQKTSSSNGLATFLALLITLFLAWRWLNYKPSPDPPFQRISIERPYPVGIEDPEEEMERMGNNATQGRIVKARSASAAQARCEQFADGRKADTPENLGDNRWKCRYS